MSEARCTASSDGASQPTFVRSRWRVRLYAFFFSSRRRHTRLTCDWSSDVCSSDLPGPGHGDREQSLASGLAERAEVGEHPSEIGRASCRERVEISVGGVSLKKKKGAGGRHEDRWGAAIGEGGVRGLHRERREQPRE